MLQVMHYGPWDTNEGSQAEVTSSVAACSTKAQGAVAIQESILGSYIHSLQRKNKHPDWRLPLLNLKLYLARGLNSESISGTA